MPISKRQAKAELRTRTKMSKEWCNRQIEFIATVPDGKRVKVLEVALEALIYRTMNPKPEIKPPKGVKPLSQTRSKYRQYTAN